tara:strand:- start:3527 stop:3877 length:351 start_codon:yes stop_codon:yes gene_type:complete
MTTGSVTLWDRIKQSLLDSATVAAEKAEYLGRIGRARLDIAETRHAIRDSLADLGGKVYTGIEAGQNSELLESDDVSTLVSRIGALEKELKSREEVLEELRATEEGSQDVTQDTEA